ncbi:MAG: histidine kinase, partial [Bacilli bacterium]
MTNTNKLIYKLFISFVLISIFPLILISWLSYNHFSTALNKELDSQANNVLEQKANTLNLFLNDLQRMEHIIVRNNIITQFLQNRDLNRYYSFFLQLDPLIEGLNTIRPENLGITLVNDYDMIYYYGYSLNREEESFLSKDWMPSGIVNSVEERPYITIAHDRPYALKKSFESANQLVFSFVQRFWDTSVRTHGLLIIDIPLHAMEQLFGFGVNKAHSGTFIIDQQGNVLFPQIPTALSNAYSKQHPKQLDVIKLHDDNEYRMFYKTDSLTGWTIVSYNLRKDLYADIRNFREIIIMVVSVSIILCLFASLYISYHFANPIMNLVKLMKNVERGDLNQRIFIKQRDEIGQLEVGFNRMIRHIRELIDKVYEEQQMKRAAEISALQAQINPHFLYNALESINALARNNKQYEISKQIALLGKLLRFSISTFKEFVPIEKEINYVEHYLLINKLRMKEDEFHYSIQFPDSILHLYTIKWILQPIVENAIIHGLEPKGRQGSIDIIGKELGDDLLITIQDNGVGISQNSLDKIRFQLEHEAESLTKYENKV